MYFSTRMVGLQHTMMYVTGVLSTLQLEQTTLDIHRSFQIGAEKLADSGNRYTNLHKSHGIEQHQWDILTQKEYWSPEQARSMRSNLANIVEVAMTIAGMPAIPLPGQYVAAVIAAIVAPCNWMVAATKAPDTFDALDASGMLGGSKVKDMTVQQLQSLIMCYGGALTGEPGAHRLPKSVGEAVKEANKK